MSPAGGDEPHSVDHQSLELPNSTAEVPDTLSSPHAKINAIPGAFISDIFC